MVIGFTTGLKAIFAAQLSLKTSGHNIANAHVKGYTRQSVLFTTDLPSPIYSVGYLGTGVKTTGIVRTVDELLEQRLRVQNGGLGRLSKEASILAQVEDIFNEPSEGALSSMMSQFFASLNDLSLDPVDPTLRSGVVMAGQIVSDSFNDLAQKLSSLDHAVEVELEAKLAKVNQMAREINALNKEISGGLAAGMQPNDLYDRRDQILKELNFIVDVDVTEESNGTLTLLVDGRIISSNSFAAEFELVEDSDGEMSVHLEGDPTTLRIQNGELKELLYQKNSYLPALETKLDSLAGELAFEFNRIHSKGVPLNGPFTSLKTEYRVKDTNKDGDPRNDPLAGAGLPFPPTAGSLFVTVTNQSTGAVEQTEITFDPQFDTMADLATELNGINRLSAYAGADGYLNIYAGAGYAFDFSPHLDADPDKSGTFGSDAARLVASGSFPVTLAAGDAFDIQVDGTNTYSVSFPAGGTYTTDQLATYINNQTGQSLATVVDGRLVLSSPSQGTNSSLLITDVSGSPSATLGLSTTLETGSDAAVQVAMEGLYTGSDNTNWRFEASGSGTIGVTPGLTVTVYDENGQQVGVLDVGENYEPGSLLEVADGVKVSFSSGDIDAAAGDFFNANLIGDSDTGNLLPALGLNTFFTGSKASDIAVRDAILETPALIAGALSHNAGDNTNVMRMADLEGQALDGLDDYTFLDYYSAAIGQIGLDADWANDMYEVQELMMSNLENQRASISGVSIDEELLNMEKAQQMLEAAARYLQVLDETNQVLMNI